MTDSMPDVIYAYEDYNPRLTTNRGWYHFHPREEVTKYIRADAVPVDVEALKREVDPAWNGHYKHGYNAAIDHLVAQGYLKQRAVPEENKAALDDMEPIKDAKNPDINREWVIAWYRTHYETIRRALLIQSREFELKEYLKLSMTVLNTFHHAGYAELLNWSSERGDLFTKAIIKGRNILDDLEFEALADTE